VALAVDGAVRAAVVFRMGVFFLVSFVRSFVHRNFGRRRRRRRRRREQRSGEE
jgi:hypothetical protein